MNNNLKQLIELQKIDSKLLNIEESKGDFLYDMFINDNNKFWK